MNATAETKAQIHADINKIRAELGQQPLAAYKAKDLSRDQLIELREQAELDLNDANDFGTETEPVVAVEIETEVEDTVVIDHETGGELGKVCKRCHEFKPWSEYLKDSKKTDGHFHMCGSRKRGCVQAYYADLKDRKDAEVLEENRRNDGNG